MAAMGELYFDGEQGDSAFWRQIESYFKQCNTDLGDGFDFATLSGDLPPPLATQWRQKFAAISEALTQWEQKFSGNIPPKSRQYQIGDAFEISSDLRWVRHFDLLELWRIRFALAAGDIDSALAAYGRMKHANDSLRRETDLIGGMLWLVCENLRLDGLQLLLESDKLTAAQLQSFTKDLNNTENLLDPMQWRSLYCEAVFDLDIFNMLEQGFRPGNCNFTTPPLGILRFVLPAAWWYAATDKCYLTGQFNLADFKQATIKTIPPKLFLSTMLTPDLSTIINKFDYLKARLRAAGVVIRAVEYQRQHGEYPKTLDNLPLDPFNNQPLQYRVGECEIEKSEVIAVDDRWETVYKEETVPGVISWSVGQDQIDNNGIPRYHTLGDKMSDDISFMIKTKP